jgi:nucleoside-diphosphate-sugar epimerase
MSGPRICILGGTGFVGQHLAARLNAMQIPTKILTRARAKHREVLVLPGIRVVEIDVHDYARLKQEFVGCDTIINLVGILNEQGQFGSEFHKVHVGLTRKIADAAISSGCRRLLHMSALNADHKSAKSFYLKTKGIAEDYVHTFCRNMKVTTFRPSVMFGPGDSLLNRFAKLLKWSPYFFPLACPRTRFAPVFVGDVVDQLIAAIDNPDTYGKRLELCGPEIYTLRELVEYTAQLLKLRRKIIDLPDALARLQAAVLEHMPGKPFSMDNYHSLQKDSVCKGKATPMPTSLKAIAPGYLTPRDTRRQYDRFRQQAHRN